MYQTIVIGAGPAGSYLAYSLARLGYKVLVLDKKAEIGQDICCTGIVGKECLDSFGIDESLILRHASSARFIAPSGESFRLWRDGEVSYVLERPALDLSLAGRAEEAGAEYILDARVTNIRFGDDCLQIDVDCCEESKIFEADTAVIAAGFGTSLPGKLDLGKIDDFIIGAQARVSVAEINEVEIYLDQVLAPGGFAWLVPTRNGEGLAGLLTRYQPGLYLGNFLGHLNERGKITSTDVEMNYGAIPLRPLPRSYTDRILVVGESAGQVKPTTGGGIYYGLLCANMAVDSLHQAFLANDFSAAELSSYEKRWHDKLDRELRIGYWAHKLYGRLSNNQIERLTHFAGDNGISSLVAASSEFSFDWHSGLILKMMKHFAVNSPLQTIGLIGVLLGCLRSSRHSVG